MNLKKRLQYLLSCSNGKRSEMKHSVIITGLLLVVYPLCGAIIFTNNSTSKIVIADTRLRKLYSIEKGSVQSLETGAHPSYFYLFSHDEQGEIKTEQRSAFMVLASFNEAADINVDMKMIEEKKLPSGMVFLTHRPLSYAEALKRVQAACQPCAARKLAQAGNKEKKK
jgi:hypothetical protein